MHSLALPAQDPRKRSSRGAPSATLGARKVPRGGWPLPGSSPVVVAPDWVPAVVALVWGITLYLGSPDGSVLLRSFPSPAAWASGLYYNCARFSAIRITKRKLGGSSFMYGTLHLFFLPISAPSKRGTCRRRSDP